MTKARVRWSGLRLIYALCALLAVALLWTSCGDDDTDGGDEATTTPVTTTASPTSTASASATVRLGIMQSLTGAGAVYGKTVVEGMELAIDELNASSDIRFEHAVVDDKSTVEGARDAFSQLGDIDVLLGPTLSGTAPEVHRLAQQASIPTLASTTTGPGITDVGNYIFRIALAEAVVVPSVIEHVAAEGALGQAVLIIDSTDAFSILSAEAMRAGLASVGGSVLTEIDMANVDVSDALAALESQTFDAFLITPLVEKSAQAVSAVRTAGFTQTIIGGNSFNTLDIARLAGPAIEGAFVGAAWNPGLAAPASRAFVDAYTEAYGHAPDQFAAQGYTTVQILADAIERAGSTEPEAIRDALAETKDLDTPLGRVSISDRRDAVHEPVIQQYHDGEHLVVQ